MAPPLLAGEVGRGWLSSYELGDNKFLMQIVQALALGVHLFEFFTQEKLVFHIFSSRFFCKIGYTVAQFDEISLASQGALRFRYAALLNRRSLFVKP